MHLQPETSAAMSVIRGKARDSASSLLQVVQHLPTTGARSVAVCERRDGIVLAVAQFAKDIPGQPPSMHGGDSNLGAPLYRWAGQAFVECGSLSLTGGEHIEFFDIGARSFIAAASIRSGAGPYDMDVRSRLWEWVAGSIVELQSFDTFGAKQWKHFSVAGRHFLALAQGVEGPGLNPSHPRTSRIFEWQSGRFAEFQTLAGRWGYGWLPIQVNGEFLLAYADHLDRSLIYRWNGDHFEPLQAIEGGGGRSFAAFQRDGAQWLVFANIQRGVELCRWNGNAFVTHARFGAPGARAVEIVTTSGGLYLFVANFIQGTPASPRVMDQSELYAWEDSGFVLREVFRTSGAVDIVSFEAGGVPHVVVANSLDADLRFRTDTTVYRFLG
jgi:hypothetical protein